MFPLSQDDLENGDTDDDDLSMDLEEEETPETQEY